MIKVTKRKKLQVAKNFSTLHSFQEFNGPSLNKEQYKEYHMIK